MTLQYSQHCMYNLRSGSCDRLDHSIWKTLVKLGVVIRRPTRRGRRAGGLKQTGLAVMAPTLADTTNIHSILVHISKRCVEPQINKRSGVNQNNLIKVDCHRQEITNDKAISTCLLNVRSAQNKPSLIADFIVENELDVLALTETWLKETDSTQSHTISEMTPSGYRCLHVPRSRGKGGGVGILFRSCVSVKQASSSTFKTFENIHVSLKAGSSHLNIYVIYRPPPNKKKWIDSRWLLGGACPNVRRYHATTWKSRGDGRFQLPLGRYHK